MTPLLGRKVCWMTKYGHMHYQHLRSVGCPGAPVPAGGALPAQVPPGMHIVDVLTELSSKGQGCVLVAGAGVGGPLAGTFTDGDLRRGLQVGSGGGVCHTDQFGLSVT